MDTPKLEIMNDDKGQPAYVKCSTDAELELLLHSGQRLLVAVRGGERTKLNIPNDDAVIFIQVLPLPSGGDSRRN